MKSLLLFLCLATYAIAANPPFDSADYVQANGEKLNGQRHVLQVVYMEEAGKRTDDSTWYYIYTAQSTSYTGAIAAAVPNDAIDRMVKKYGLSPSPRAWGEPYKRRPLRARVQWDEKDRKAYLDIETILLVP